MVATRAMALAGRRRGLLVASACLPALLLAAGCRKAAEPPVPAAGQAARMVAQLRDGQPLEREVAARVLGDIKDPNAADALIEAARADTAVRVRVAALRALAKYGRLPDAVRLIDLLRDDSAEIRLVACETLGLLQVVQAAGALADRTRDSVATVRMASLAALGRLGPAGQDKLMEAFRNSGEDERAAVVEAFGDSGDRRRAPLLIEALKAENTFLRRRAAEAMGRLGDAAAIGPLAELIRRPLSDREAKAYADRAAGPITKKDQTRILRELNRELVSRGRAPDDRAHSWIYNNNGEGGRGVFRRLIAREQAAVERSVREIALRALLAIGTRDALATVLGFLGDDNADVAKLAAEETVRLGPPAQEGLLALLSDASGKPAARAKAAELLAQLGADKQRLRAALLAAVGGPDGPVRCRCALLLAEMKAPEALGPLAAMLNAGDAPGRLAAAEALGRLADARATPALVKAAGAGETAVRVKAVEALAAIGDPNAAGPLLAVCRSLEGRPERRQLLGPLVRAFAATRAREAVDILIEQVRRPSGTNTYHDALRALGAIGDPRAVPAMIEALSREPLSAKVGVNHDAEIGIPALARIGDERAIPFFLRLRRSSWTNVPRLATIGLGQLKSARGVEELIRMLADPAVDKGVKESSVAPGLIEAGPVAVPALLKLLTDSPPQKDDTAADPGFYAAELLGYAGKPALPALLKLAADEKRPHVLGRVIEALRAMNDPAALAALGKLLQHGDPVIRKWAAGGLGRCATPGAVELLKSAAGDADPSVRQAVEWALETQKRSERDSP